MSEHTSTAGSESTRYVRVWDLPTRVFHWALVALIFTSWLTSEIGGNAMTYHLWSGYCILALVLFRVAWGLVGSEYARFSTLFHGPVAVWRYARGLIRLDPPYYLGHNPLGGWSVVLLLLAVLVQAVSGLFTTDEIFTDGPLVKHVSGATSDLLSTVHRWNFYVLLCLISVHVAAALFYLVVKKQNLIGAMFTGRKRVPPQGQWRDARMASAWLALLFIGLASAAVALLVNI